MSIDFRQQKAVGTAHKLVIRSLTFATTFQQNKLIGAGTPTTAKISTQIGAPVLSQKIGIDEVSDDEFMALLLEEEPRYNTLYQKLAKI